MSEERRIRDPIHGFVTLSRKEIDVVDTTVFQRLRSLRQLALAHLVYPGALHTRFEHSLGVCQIAGFIADALKLNGDDRILVRLAALLHDLGHGPFSHVSEDALQIYADQEKIAAAGGNTEKIHELITGGLVRAHPDLDRILSAKEREQIARLLSSGYGDPVLRSIVSGPLDADKQDYLLRDSHYCGVKYGIFDLHQLHKVLVCFDDPTGGRLLMVSPDGVHALEQFVMAKYYLTTQVVRHKVRLITDQMILRGISLGIDCDRVEPLYQVYSFDGSQDFIERYTAWSDDALLAAFSTDQYRGSHCHALFTRLRQRRLFKRVFEIRLPELSVMAREALLGVSKPPNRQRRRDLERALYETMARAGARFDAEVADASTFVIAHSYTIKSVKEHSGDDEGPILITRLPRPVPFEEESTFFRSITDKLNETRFEVYAPVYYETAAEKRELKTRLRTPITATIEAWA
jgi:uncharacterized protein